MENKFLQRNIYRKKNLKSLKNNLASKAETCMEASSGRVHSGLFILWNPGGNIGGWIITSEFIKKKL